MRIARIIEGNLYVTAKGHTIRCSAPFACLGSESGLCVYLWEVDGQETAETRDGTLRPASMREQRDFWKRAFARTRATWNDALAAAIEEVERHKKLMCATDLSADIEEGKAK